MKRVLTIAGSDSGGGAGIQADLKTITVLGAYGMSVVTAVTAQNTLGVQGVHPVPPEFVRLQLQSVLSDIGADGVKTGMLVDHETVLVVALALKRFRVKNLVVDPVLSATSGDRLLESRALQSLRENLLPLTRVVTPNLQEAAVLSKTAVDDLETMKTAAQKIHSLGPGFVLVKGGHLKGEAVDVLFDGKRFETFRAPRLTNPNTHGTGCTLSAALTVFLARGMDVPEAVGAAKQFITKAISGGLDLGAGRGPVNPRG